MDTYPKLPPRSRLARACKYMQRRWLNLIAYAYDGRIPIDNTRVERAIRGLALGRNYAEAPVMWSLRLGTLASSGWATGRCA